MKILVLNAGSSSLKGLLCEVAEPLPSRARAPLWKAHAQWGREQEIASLKVETTNGNCEQEVPFSSPKQLTADVLQTLCKGSAAVLASASDVAVVGHRIVHGGRNLRSTARITPEVKAEIARAAEFAPEHNRLELEVIEAAEQLLGPQIPQVAVFDTAFHDTLPHAAKVYPGPYSWLDQGIERYGFHGISHQYVSRRGAEILGRDLASLRMITCHLGNGCSLAAIRNGRSVDTTMGFTPLEGLMMGTRSGSIDPGIIIYLLRHKHYGADDLDRILNEESGLKGVSGVSGDMRAVLSAISEGNQRAKLAFEVYAHSVARGIGAMLASLGGLDALVFTAGVGENCAPLRDLVCKRFDFAGVQCDDAKNNASPGDADIATADSPVRVLVIHTEEDWEIMRECWNLIRL
ncbi:MAG: acetate kinase [Acidobacteria bacterium]|nr:acetate kinase [Acidobacteriota bacterium]